MNSRRGHTPPPPHESSRRHRSFPSSARLTLAPPRSIVARLRTENAEERLVQISGRGRAKRLETSLGRAGGIEEPLTEWTVSFGGVEPAPWWPRHVQCALATEERRAELADLHSRADG